MNPSSLLTSEINSPISRLLSDTRQGRASLPFSKFWKKYHLKIENKDRYNELVDCNSTDFVQRVNFIVNELESGLLWQEAQNPTHQIQEKMAKERKFSENQLKMEYGGLNPSEEITFSFGQNKEENLRKAYGYFEKIIYQVGGINQPIAKGDPLIVIASKQGLHKVVQLLIKKNANLNIRTSCNCTPAHFAALNGHSDVLKLLIEHRANLTMLDGQGMTPLHQAILHCSSDEIKALNLTKEQLSLRDQHMQSLLHCAVRNSKIEIVKYLLNSQINVNSFADRKITPLHIAVENGEKEIIGLLCHSLADINAQRSDGYTPTHLAAFKGDFAILEFFVSLGANLSIKTLKNETLLHLAVLSSNIKSIVYLNLKGLDVEAKLNCGCTPLHLAIRTNNLSAVKYLIQVAHADITQRACNGFNALHIALAYRHHEIARYLNSVC